MSPTATIVLMALVTFGPRLAGFLLAGVRVPPFWQRFLSFVPISVFAALIVPALPGADGDLPARLLAAGAATLLLWRVRSLALAIAVGMTLFWLLRP